MYFVVAVITKHYSNLFFFPLKIIPTYYARLFKILCITLIGKFICFAFFFVNNLLETTPSFAKKKVMLLYDNWWILVAVVYIFCMKT